jgi:predicted DCC family thiol-disulfide oxidoreductase YuxK
MAVMNVTLPLTIFFDASCPVCAHEVALLKKYDRREALNFIDCSPVQFQTPVGAPAGVTRAAMMSRIHGHDATGQWLVAEKLFAAAYAACGFALLANLWGHPKLERFWQRVYPWVADNRMILSKLGVGFALAWLLRLLAPRAAKRASEASQACAIDCKNCDT